MKRNATCDYEMHLLVFRHITKKNYVYIGDALYIKTKQENKWAASVDGST